MTPATVVAITRSLASVGGCYRYVAAAFKHGQRATNQTETKGTTNDHD